MVKRKRDETNTSSRKRAKDNTFGLKEYYEAIDRTIDNPTLENHLLLYSFELDDELDINARVDDEGNTLLHLLATMDDKLACEQAELILNKEANTELTEGHFCWTALHEAAAANNIAMVELLLEYEADQFVRDVQGNTPVMLAISLHLPEMVKVLFDSLNDHERQNMCLRVNKYGYTISDLIVKKSFDQSRIKEYDAFTINTLSYKAREIATYLVDENLGFAPITNIEHFIDAIYCNCESSIQRYLDYYKAGLLDINNPTNFDDYMVIEAALHNRFELLISLIHDLNPDLMVRDSTHMNILHGVARSGNTDLALFVLDVLTEEQIGILFEQQDDDDDTPTDCAYAHGYPEVVAIFLEFGGVLNAMLQNDEMQDEGQEIQINTNQSTHEVSIHQSISRSTLALVGQYLPDIYPSREKNDDFRITLSKWADANLSDKNINQYAEKARKKLRFLLVHPLVKNFITEYNIKLKEFVLNLREDECQFEAHCKLKLKSAKTAITRILDTNKFERFEDSRSGAPITLGLALVWAVIQDDDALKRCSLKEGKNCNKIKLSNVDKANILVKMFYEMERGYNLDNNGNEVDLNSENQNICHSGHYNKAISTLSGLHPKVDIITVNTAIICTKMYALLEQHYQSLVPAQVQVQNFYELKTKGILPKNLWDKHLREKITAELENEYGSYINAEMIADSVLRCAILTGASTHLPQNTLNNLLQTMRIGDESISKDRVKVVIDNLHLIQCQLIEEESILNLNADIIAKAKKLGVEFPVHENYTFDRTFYMRPIKLPGFKIYRKKEFEKNVSTFDFCTKKLEKTGKLSIDASKLNIEQRTTLDQLTTVKNFSNALDVGNNELKNIVLTAIKEAEKALLEEKNDYDSIWDTFHENLQNILRQQPQSEAISAITKTLEEQDNEAKRAGKLPCTR